MRKRDWTGVITLSLAVILLGVAASPADEKQQGQPKGEEEALPDTPEAIWHVIGEYEEQLSETIAQGKLSEVHVIAFAIRDLVKALPERSTDLSDTKQKQLGGYVGRIADHARNLDSYGDNGLQEKSEAEFEQLMKRLDYMRKLYPETMFAHEEDEHHDGH